jgi:hypothetical protein
MKYLLLTILVITFISCGNDKERIVEQIKALKDTLAVISIEADQLAVKQNQRVHAYLDTAKNPTAAAKVVFENEINKQFSPEKLRLDLRKRDAQSKIDSLELELKKY